MAALAALSFLSTATVVDVAGAAVSSSAGTRAGGSLNLLQVNLAWSSMDPNQPTSTASFTVSQPQRRALYVRAQEILAKDLPWIALFNGPQVWAVNKKVHDWPPIDSINASGLAGVWLS